ncbi:helix-turn-helix domain-containing protein [Silicimonas algicola]|uniref:Homeodomain-like domain-containing protein n=1 Tax=Silicimonas algicola TaxID=1826607 RepID=A0A316FTT3_9RHOB|nr:helix-turn-helix domain-containing protein [Silicimonas algicola]PWK51672.1 hypothetical protein C8D95_11715 [Silicimonas algicola]
MPPTPIALTEAQAAEIETLAALLNQEQIADYLGVSRRTFQNILARDEDIAARYKRGKAKAIAHVANGLLQKARSGCTTSSIFYLKTQGGWRETERIEHAVARTSIEAMSDANFDETLRVMNAVLDAERERQLVIEQTPDAVEIQR